MEENEEGFFVGINNPIDVRRNLLECSREMVKTLQSYEKIKLIREEKIRRMQQLKTVVRELDLLFSKLKTELPRTHMRAGNPEPATRVVPEKQEKKKQRFETSDELSRLEDQLASLEREISKLT